MARRRREISFPLCFVLRLCFVFVFSGGFFTTINLCKEYERKLIGFDSGVSVRFKRWPPFDAIVAKSLLSPRLDPLSGSSRSSLFPPQCLSPHTSYLQCLPPSHNPRRHSIGLALSSYPIVANGYEFFSAYNRRSISASLDLVSESVLNYLSVRLTEETLVSVSRRSRRASLVTNLGQNFGLKLQRMNPSWAWPINVLTWIFNGHISFVDVKPTWPIRGSLLACPKLPILQLPQISTGYVSFGCFLHIRLLSMLLSLLSPLRPVSAGDSAQLPPLYLSSVAPGLVSWNESVSTLHQSSLMLPDSSPHQPSSCRGQERTLSSSSCLKERTLSQKSFSMEAASGSLWMNLRPVFGLLASHGFLLNFQTPRSFLSILLLPIRHCLGSLVDLDVRRLHLRLWLPRMFGIYIGCARILVNAPFVTLVATSYHWKKQVCLNSLLVPSAPTCQLFSQGRRLGSDLNSQGQTDYKLCVEFLNLHGQWLHVREDPPALLRFVTHQMRFPVSSSSKATSTWQPSNPLVSSVEHTFKSSYASIVRAKYDHLLVRDFMKLVFKLESYKTSKDLPSFASSSRLCIFLEDSCSLYLYISCNLLFLSCKNIPLLRF